MVKLSKSFYITNGNSRNIKEKMTILRWYHKSSLTELQPPNEGNAEVPVDEEHNSWYTKTRTMETNQLGEKIIHKTNLKDTNTKHYQEVGGLKEKEESPICSTFLMILIIIREVLFNFEFQLINLKKGGCWIIIMVTYNYRSVTLFYFFFL